MYRERIALEREREAHERHKPEDHLARSYHSRVELCAARLHEHVRPRRARRAHNYRGAPRERTPAFRAELIREDNADADDAEKYARHLTRVELFARKVSVRNQHPVRGYGRL